MASAIDYKGNRDKLGIFSLFLHIKKICDPLFELSYRDSSNKVLQDLLK